MGDPAKGRQRTVLVGAVVTALIAIGAVMFVVAGGSGPRFESASEVVAALAEEGVECYDFRTLDAPQESIKDFGLCFLSEGHDYETDIYVFEDSAIKESWMAGFEGKIGLLVGQNWFITNGSDAEMDVLQESLGGQIR